MNIVKVAQSLVVPTFATFGIAGTGCSVGNESDQSTLEEQRQDELLELAQDVSTPGDEDPPYSETCDFYGDCVYCESRDVLGWPPCTLVCYAACCYGDCVSDCYMDCSLSV